MKTMNLPSIDLLLFLFLQIPVYANDLAAVDQAVRAYPNSFSAPQQFADRINKDFKDPVDKARAIYTWIALNVKYDMAEFRNNAKNSRVAFTYSTEMDKQMKLRKYNLDLANKTLRSKKGVCRGYAALFDLVAYLTGLEATTIPGTSKTSPVHIGKLPTSGDHIWNAVRIGGKWQMVDVTWASGAVNSSTGKFESKFNDGYFFTDQYVFFLNHFPEDERWLPSDLNAGIFATLPLFYGPYMDSEYTLSFPKSGILPAGYVVPFTFQNLSADKIAYSISGGEIQFITGVKKDDASVFEIPIPERTRGYLTIYIRHESIAAFRIDPSRHKK